MATNLLNANPGILFVIAYHPDNSPSTSTDPMARTFPAAFYSTTFNGAATYMPSAMINRRLWGSERILQVNYWWSHINTVKAEASPLNVGVSSNYNNSNGILNVNIEVYFTSDITVPLTIYAELTEDSIVADQTGGSSPYVHNHVFRETFVAQWGDGVSTPTTQGTLKTFTYTFNNTTANYDMTKCDVIAFVRNAANEEIISGNGAPVGQSTVAIIEADQIDNNISVYPNLLNETTQINFSVSNPEKVEYSICNLIGQKIFSENMGALNSGNYSVPIDKSIFNNNGMYIINIKIGQNNYMEKLLVK